MKIAYNKKIILLLMLSLTFGLVSCGITEDERQGSITDNINISQKAGTVQLYHATAEGVEPDEERYQLKQPDNLSAALEEVIEAMTLDPMVSIERYDKDITEETKLLNDAAIVKSVENLDFITVYIISLGEGDKELETATYTDSSFYYYNE